jgi:hypothetical protein
MIRFDRRHQLFSVACWSQKSAARCDELLGQDTGTWLTPDPGYARLSAIQIGSVHRFAIKPGMSNPKDIFIFGRGL